MAGRRTRRQTKNAGRDGRLHGDLLDHIFERMSLADLVGCRLVCHEWRCRLDIQKLTRRCCISPSSQELWLKPEHVSKHMCPDTHMSQLCGSMNLPRSFAVSSNLKADASVMASAHGIVCFLFESSQEQRLSVYNPASRQGRVLPRMQHITKVEAVGVKYSILNKCYTILVTGRCYRSGMQARELKDPYYYSIVEVFNSSRGSWIYHSMSETDTETRKGRIVWWQGQFHWMVHFAGCHFNRKLALLAYDMQEKRWQTCQTEGLQAIQGTLPDMWVSNGRLMCKEVNVVLGRPQKWVLQAGSKEWERVDSRDGHKSMLIAAHSGAECSKPLKVCIYDPYCSGPIGSPLLCSRRRIVHSQLQITPSHRFPFTPCLSVRLKPEA